MQGALQSKASMISTKHINTAVSARACERSAGSSMYCSVLSLSLTTDVSFSIGAVQSLGLVLLAHDIQKHL